MPRLGASAALTLAALIVLSEAAGAAALPKWQQHGRGLQAPEAGAPSIPATLKTLVLYTVGQLEDPTTLQNLGHFVATALGPTPPAPGASVDVAVLLPFTAAAAAGDAPGGLGPSLAAGLPALPPPQGGVTARYVFDAPPCAAGWGAAGWFLREHEPGAAERCDAVVMLMSAVAGPFLPKYAQARVHWLLPFLRKLTGRVKMVTATISCAQTRSSATAAAGANATAPAAPGPSSRQVPHPELGAVALSADALRLLLAGDEAAARQAAAQASSAAVDSAPTDARPGVLAALDQYVRRLRGQETQNQGVPSTGGEQGQDGVTAAAAAAAAEAAARLRESGVFGSYQSRMAAEHHAAAAAAEALLARGWSLDCLMLRYQGIDWTERHHWRCNAGVKPQGSRLYDGISLDPLEVVFVRRQQHLLARGDPAATRAGQMQEWAEAARGPVGAALAAAASNRHREAAAAAQALRQLEANAMSGPECFDTEFYAAAHRDLWHLAGDAEALYLHYEEFGMAEGRRHRWKCEQQREALVVAPLQQVVRAMADADKGMGACEGELATLWAVAGTLPAICRAAALEVPA